ncbi:histidine kinase N-terminal 7TM domain-containing diguanylate cyclase [Paenibacillus mendelii]|uniref:Histidine kinase N-terminal 7TM domain-containing protein n=1 Tax=Paenibacillus mendelii TaxID=206163 RepID=A0ABV6J6Y4_9BACL|nr:histidine kinase N-terminal 7TM domain-containing protein [Paenibacillus mendelii]MCQ6560985.1 diguanylate cyclase [Paenibacillus mendelii]
MLLTAAPEAEFVSGANGTMGTPYSAVITLIVAAGVINVLMGIYVLSNRTKHSMAKTFIFFTLLSAIYTFGSALELSAGSLAEIKFWIKFEYLGMPFLPPLNLLIIMHFLGMDRYLKRAWKMALFIMPAVTLALVWTNESHHLYYRSIGLREGTTMLKADLGIGPWYIIQGGYTFACMIGGVTLLLLYWQRMKSYRPQIFIMLTGLLLPLAGDFAYLGQLTPEGMDPIPVIMTGTSALYLWALASRGMMNVAPIARDNLFESMRDGVLVLDLENRLVDYNPAAAVIIPELSANSIGHRIEPLWRMHTDEPLLDAVRKDRKERTAETSSIQEMEWRVGEQAYDYHIRSSIVRKKGGQETGKLIVLIDVTERVRLHKQLHELAYHDGLTGIFNRIHFIHLSEELLANAGADGSSLALVLFDIDYFKRINDTYGHDIDRALLHIVEICRRMLRPQDVFARYGGEEFVIAMPGLSPTEAESAAQRIRSEIAGQPMSGPQGNLPITASFGVAVSQGGLEFLEEEATINLLLKDADRALYEAKNAGRNTVRLAGSAKVHDATG